MEEHKCGIVYLSYSDLSSRRVFRNFFVAGRDPAILPGDLHTNRDGSFFVRREYSPTMFAPGKHPAHVLLNYSNDRHGINIDNNDYCSAPTRRING